MKEAWLQFGFILVEQYTTSCKKIAASAGVGTNRLTQQIFKVIDSSGRPALNSAESK